MVAILQHLERLAVPRLPIDFAAEIDRGVRDAIKIRHRNNMLDTARQTLYARPTTREKSLSMAHTHSLENAGDTTTNARTPDANKPAPAHSQATSLADSQRIPAQEPGAPSSLSMPFCMDASSATFGSFVAVIGALRETMKPIPTGLLPRCCAAISNDRCSRTHRKARCNVHPENSSFIESSVGGSAKEEAVDNCVNTKESETRLRTEALRCTLKILQLNVFHLVRATAARRYCRGHDDGGMSPPLHARNPGFEEQDHPSVRRSSRDAWTNADALRCSQQDGTVEGRKYSHDAEVSSLVQQPILKRSGREQGQHRIEHESADDMGRVMQELHGALRAILAAGSCEVREDATGAAGAVQVGRNIRCVGNRRSHRSQITVAFRVCPWKMNAFEVCGSLGDEGGPLRLRRSRNRKAILLVRSEGNYDAPTDEMLVAVALCVHVPCTMNILGALDIPT